MNRHLVRLVASVATVSLLSMAGAGMAAATPPAPAQAQEQSATAPVERIQDLHDQIEAAHTAADAVLLLQRVNDLRPALADVRDLARSEQTLHLVDEADDTASEIQRILPLAGLPNPIQMVTGLVTSLLALLQSLLAGLLGGLPVPVPVPPIPPIPVPVPPVPVPTP